MVQKIAQKRYGDQCVCYVFPWYGLREKNFWVCPKVSGMSRFADIFLLSCETGPRASLTPKGPFEKNCNESRKAATKLRDDAKLLNARNSRF